jgi:hypothetical protein
LNKELLKFCYFCASFAGVHFKDAAPAGVRTQLISGKMVFITQKSFILLQHFEMNLV